MSNITEVYCKTHLDLPSKLFTMEQDKDFFERVALQQLQDQLQYGPPIYIPPGVKPAEVYHKFQDEGDYYMETLLRGQDVLDRINFPELYSKKQQADKGHVKAVGFSGKQAVSLAVKKASSKK